MGSREGQELVSAIIPAYNAAHTIDETLRSVRFQTYKNLEIIVVDDGSTDNTAEIVRNHAKADGRVRLLSQKNAGVAAARNLGVSVSSAELVAPIDADDLWRADKIERQVAVLQERGPRVGLVYCRSARIDAKSRIIGTVYSQEEEGDVLALLCHINMVGNGSAALMRKTAVIEAGGYDTTLRARGAQGCEDLKLYIRIAEEYHFAVVREQLTGYRNTDSNMSHNMLQMMRSRRIVISECMAKHPEYKPLLRDGQRIMYEYMVVRAIDNYDYGQVVSIVGAMCKHDPDLAPKVLKYVPTRLIRSLTKVPAMRISRAFRPKSTDALPRFEIGEPALYSPGDEIIRPFRSVASSEKEATPTEFQSRSKVT